MDRKNPPIAHIRVDAAPFRYFEVLKISVEIYIQIIRYKYRLNATIVITQITYEISIVNLFS